MISRPPHIGKPGRFGPLLLSTLKGERKAYTAAHHHRDRQGIVVASYNVHKCVGTDKTFDPGRTARVIQEVDADVIALQEVDLRFGGRDGLLDLEALERKTGLKPVPLIRTRNSHGWRGNLVLVREGIVASTRRLVLPGAEPRGGLIVDLELSGERLRIIAAHLGLLRRSRSRQIEAILAEARPADGRSVILMGDLNEWRLGKRSSLRGLEPTFGPLEAEVASFPSHFPVWSLDRIVANPHAMISHIQVHDTALARVASDHLPIKALVSPAAGNRQLEAVAELATAA